MADSQPSLTVLLSELLLFIDADGKQWEHAADECEKFSTRLSTLDETKMYLNSAMYRVRAEMHQNIVASIKTALASDEHTQTHAAP